MAQGYFAWLFFIFEHRKKPGTLALLLLVLHQNYQGCRTITSPMYSPTVLQCYTNHFSQPVSISRQHRQANPNTILTANLTLHADTTAGQLFRDYTFSKSDTKGTARTRTARRELSMFYMNANVISRLPGTLHTPSFAIIQSFTVDHGTSPNNKHAALNTLQWKQDCI